MHYRTLFLLPILGCLLLACCGYDGHYPDLADGPTKDQKSSMTLAEAQAELALMQKERDQTGPQ